LGLVTNGKLSSPSLPSCFFSMMNNVVAPIIQNRGDYTVLAKRTNWYLLLLLLLYMTALKNLRLTSSRYLGSPFLQFYKTDKNLGLSLRNFIFHGWENPSPRAYSIGTNETISLNIHSLCMMIILHSMLSMKVFCT
jgi:hypothetical protein